MGVFPYHCESTNDICTWLLFHFFLHPELRNIAILLLRAKITFPSQLLNCPLPSCTNHILGCISSPACPSGLKCDTKTRFGSMLNESHLSVPIKHLPSKTNYFSPFLSLRRFVEQDEVVYTGMQAMAWDQGILGASAPKGSWRCLHSRQYHF